MARIEEVKRRVWMSTVLLRYGWDGYAIGVGNWKKVHCPFHKDDNPSASINSDKNRFNCFTCGVRGDIIDVVRQREGISDVREAVTWIENRF